MSQPTIDPVALERGHWGPQERQNAQAVLAFVQLIMNDHDFEAVRERYAGGVYQQHNRNIADGVEGVIRTVGDLVKRAPEFSYDVKQVFVDGEHVVLHSHATLKAAHRGDEARGLNIIDTWRVTDGRLVEHWDAVQGLDVSMRLYGLFTGGQVRNNNGVF